MSKYKFDVKTGTMIPTKDMAPEKETVEVSSKDISKNLDGGINIAPKPESPNLDVDEAEIVFKKFSDMSVMRIDDQATGTWLCYFAGYALDISFNIEELRKGNATKKMEACLEGLTRLFRKIILDQAIGGNKQ